MTLSPPIEIAPTLLSAAGRGLGSHAAHRSVDLVVERFAADDLDGTDDARVLILSHSRGIFVLVE
jgi:hypothetical protein